MTSAVFGFAPDDDQAGGGLLRRALRLLDLRTAVYLGRPIDAVRGLERDEDVDAAFAEAPLIAPVISPAFLASDAGKAAAAMFFRTNDFDDRAGPQIAPILWRTPAPGALAARTAFEVFKSAAPVGSWIDWSRHVDKSAIDAAFEADIDALARRIAAAHGPVAPRAARATSASAPRVTASVEAPAPVEVEAEHEPIAAEAAAPVSVSAIEADRRDDGAADPELGQVAAFFAEPAPAPAEAAASATVTPDDASAEQDAAERNAFEKGAADAEPGEIDAPDSGVADVTAPEAGIAATTVAVAAAGVAQVARAATVEADVAAEPMDAAASVVADEPAEAVEPVAIAPVAVDGAATEPHAPEHGAADTAPRMIFAADPAPLGRRRNRDDVNVRGLVKALARGAIVRASAPKSAGVGEVVELVAELTLEGREVEAQRRSGAILDAPALLQLEIRDPDRAFNIRPLAAPTVWTSAPYDADAPVWRYAVSADRPGRYPIIIAAHVAAVDAAGEPSRAVGGERLIEIRVDDDERARLAVWARWLGFGAAMALIGVFSSEILAALARGVELLAGV